MNSTYTVDHSYTTQVPEVPTTVFFFFCHDQQSVKSFDLPRIARVAGLAIWLTVSPITAINDPWLIERRRRDDVMTISIYQEVLGRFISRAEALRIASAILEQAERERLILAEFEAARGIQWENQL